jgi:hypothetical protein
MRGPMLAVALSLAAALASGGEPPPADSRPTGEQARAAFARIQSLAGDWEGRSTKGWTETLRYRVIAGGSAVLETSFEAHPGEEMATVFHMDGDRLVLTHYCVAKNQPRLEATSIRDGGRTVVFTFRDGGNIPTRDRGHMDSAVFTFDAPDRVTSRWSWYEAGKESWFEDIVATRTGEKGH